MRADREPVDDDSLHSAASHTESIVARLTPGVHEQDTPEAQERYLDFLMSVISINDAVRAYASGDSRSAIELTRTSQHYLSAFRKDSLPE
jgi:hypothetical protein